MVMEVNVGSVMEVNVRRVTGGDGGGHGIM